MYGGMVGEGTVVWGPVGGVERGGERVRVESVGAAWFEGAESIVARFAAGGSGVGSWLLGSSQACEPRGVPEA